MSRFYRDALRRISLTVGSVSLTGALTACGSGGYAQTTPQFETITAQQYTSSINPTIPSASLPRTQTVVTSQTAQSSQLGPLAFARGPQPSQNTTAGFIGIWTGTSAQVLWATTFNTAVILQPSSGNTVTGDLQLVEGKYSETITITGSVTQGVLTYKETGIMQKTATPSNLTYWCPAVDGSFAISSNGETLNGSFNDPGCNSGTITLQKGSEEADEVLVAGDDVFFSGHSITRMQQRGISPASVLAALRQIPSPGSNPGTLEYNFNGVTVITGSNGRIVTLY